MIGEGRLPAQLRDLLGEEGYVRLCQALGGVRVYVPYKLRDDNDLVVAIGRDLAETLSAKYAPATFRVPLARRERALHLRAKGCSNAAIARALGVTESAVEKIFAREEGLPPRPPSGNSRAQLTLL